MVHAIVVIERCEKCSGAGSGLDKACAECNGVGEVAYRMPWGDFVEQIRDELRPIPYSDA